MKKENNFEDAVIFLLKGVSVFIAVYFMIYFSEANSENIWTILKKGILELIKYFAIPFVVFSIAVFQFMIAYKNREITRNKIKIELEDKATKELNEIKEILEGLVEANSDDYDLLLITLKIKDKSIEEKLLDKMEGKRFKFSLNYENEELEYKKQIIKMNKIINKNIENISYFLVKEENIFDLTEENVKSLQDNMRKINDYFQNTYKKKTFQITIEQEIKEDIFELLDELKEVTNSEKIESIKASLNKIQTIKKKEKELNWFDVQNAAKEMIKIIEKI